MCGSVSLPNQPADDAVLWTTSVHKSGVGIRGDEERRKGKVSIYWILNLFFWYLLCILVFSKGILATPSLKWHWPFTSPLRGWTCKYAVKGNSALATLFVPFLTATARGSLAYESKDAPSRKCLLSKTMYKRKTQHWTFISPLRGWACKYAVKGSSALATWFVPA